MPIICRRLSFATGGKLKMAQFTIGGIRVIDLNNNDRFDGPETDRITTADGSVTLSPTAPEVEQVRRLLGVGSLEGVKLSASAELVNRLLAAKSLARDGDVHEVTGLLLGLDRWAEEGYATPKGRWSGGAQLAESPV